MQKSKQYSGIKLGSNLTAQLQRQARKLRSIGESFQDHSWIQDFEADFLWSVSLKMLN